MRLPRINWMKLAESLAAADPYAAALMADASIQTHGDQMPVTQPGSGATVNPEARNAASSRRGARAVHPVPAAV